ncbi:hypothetical protein DFH09DRAFT_1319537 [Mycena vulgaris]|nr:hypothetical protein DFH09DRAFT_1319537 [Mycena vulgaris]
MRPAAMQVRLFPLITAIAATSTVVALPLPLCLPAFQPPLTLPSYVGLSLNASSSSYGTKHAVVQNDR